MPRRSVLALLALLLFGSVAWLIVGIVRDRSRDPAAVAQRWLSDWVLAPGGPGEAAVVGLEPPAALAAALVRHVRQRTNATVTAPTRVLVPLVLQAEYSDSLQGVFGIEHIVAVARAAGLESATFEPVCLGERRDPMMPSRVLYFVAFRSPLFDRVRQDLVPLHPEHAGTVPFEPAALQPILILGGSDPRFDSWWPFTFDARGDCRAAVRVEPPRQAREPSPDPQSAGAGM